MERQHNGNEALFRARYKAVKEAMQLGKRQEVGQSVRELVRQGPGTVSRCAVLLNYGIAAAYCDRDETSLTMLKDVYEAAGMLKEYEDQTGYDLMHDRVHFFSCAGHLPRRALSMLLNKPAVEAASRFFMVPGGMWPYDLMACAASVKKYWMVRLKASHVFESDYEDDVAAEMFKMCCFLGSAMELLRQDIMRGDHAYVAWDGFALVERGFEKQQVDVRGVYKRFMDTVPAWTSLVPGRHQYVVCSEFFKIYTSDAYGFSAGEARERAVYKCILAYQGPNGRDSAYPALAWGGSPVQLRAALTNFGAMIITGEPLHLTVAIDAGDVAFDDFQGCSPSTPSAEANDLLRALDAVAFSPPRAAVELSQPNSAVSLADMRPQRTGLFDAVPEEVAR